MLCKTNGDYPHWLEFLPPDYRKEVRDKRKIYKDGLKEIVVVKMKATTEKRSARKKKSGKCGDSGKCCVWCCSFICMCFPMAMARNALRCFLLILFILVIIVLFLVYLTL